MLILISERGNAQLSVTLTTSNYHGKNISCFGAQDGSINITATGGSPPYTYLWSNGYAMQNASDLAAGYYRISVTDAAMNSVIREITLTQPEQLNYEMQVYEYPNGYNVSCYNCYNGSVTVTIYGGTAPYSAMWDDGNTNINRTNLGAGAIEAELTDLNGCHVNVARTEISQPERSDWTMNGNTNSNPATQFIGTSDNKDFVFRTNNTERFRVKSNGDFKLAGLGSTVGMLYVDANGILQAGNKPTPCLPLQGPPVWQSIVSPATIWTCTDVKVGLGTTSPLAKLDVTHDEPQGGLILHQYNTTNNFKPSEIKFMHNNLAQWSIGSHLDPVSSGPHSFFIWNIPNTKPSLYIDQSTNRFLINSLIPSWATHPFQLTVSHVENHGGIAINKSTFSNRKSQISFQQNFTEKYAIGIDRDHLNEQNFFIWDAEEGVTRLIIDKDGRVAIGTEPPVIWNTTVNYKLYVGDGIATRDVKVTSQNWPDYVFEKDYHLEDIDALKSFITKNKHLPGIPSAQEIAKNNGFELGAMQVLLLQKLEEQTLYIIQLQEQINRLNKIIIEDPKQKGGLDEK